MARLPVGRVHATGRMFVPFVRLDLYDKLLAAAPAASSQQQGGPSQSGSSGRAGSGGKPAGSPPNLPRTWESIGVGDLVVAFESADEGWYEAIVAEASGDMLTLRWRDYPKERRVVRHRNRLGLLHPNLPTSAEPSKPSKAAATKEATSTRSDDTSSTPLPTTWDEVDVGHLVLAKTDAPWGTWWEALIIAKAGDGVTLRWRDNFANVGPLIRRRFDLALIRPDAA